MQDETRTEAPDDLIERISREIDEAFARMRRPLDVPGWTNGERQPEPDEEVRRDRAA